MPWAVFWQLDRNGSNPTPSHAGPSLLAATPTRLRGTQSIDTAVYCSLTSCHSNKSPVYCAKFEFLPWHMARRMPPYVRELRRFP